MQVIESVRLAGVVGAGGAGFPTHVKLDAKVDVVIANGAECEPLLHKDAELMERYADRVVQGMQLALQATGASEGIIGIKSKRTKAIAALEKAVTGTPIRIHQLGDYYPTGDEFVLVYETTGRLIPAGGIPLQIGAVVSNVESLYNIAQASESLPVTAKFLTVAGAVQQPMSTCVPIGITLAETLQLAGGPTVDAYAVFVGGVMMGQLEWDLSLPVTKTTGGLIVLPRSHSLVERRARPEQHMHRIGKSACDQCSYCTEFCPRYLLGYDVQPHKVMRTLGFTASGSDIWSKWADLCCACGLCTQYACPEDLYPKEACDKGKVDRKNAGLERWLGPTEEIKPHPMADGRHVPLKSLVRRLGLTSYDVPAPWTETRYPAKRVVLPLQQHVGAPAQTLVSLGQRVSVGQPVADIPESKLSARIHASIAGTVTEITDSIVIEEVS